MDPENVDSLLRLTRCRLEREEYEVALEVAARLDGLPLDPDERSLMGGWLERAAHGLEVAERGRQRREERERAAQARRERLRQEAETVTSPRAALGLGKAYANRDYERAIAFLERGLALATSRGDRIALLTTLGPILRDHGQADAALETLEQAIALDPSHSGNPAAYTAYAATLRRLGRLDDAREHAEAVRNAHRDDPFILNALGAVYAELVRRDGDADLVHQAEQCFVDAARLGGERLTTIRYLRKLIEDVRYAGARAEASGERGVMLLVEREIAVLERHIRRFQEQG